MEETSQLFLFDDARTRVVQPFRSQLLKWVGNKQRFAHEIISCFPVEFGTYFEPFLGSGAVLGTLAPNRAVGSDVFKPLMEIWQTLQDDSETLDRWYAERWHAMMSGDKVAEYERIKAAYNVNPNAADLLFICRSCYGGVVRFRQSDGYISTPCGIHTPISPKAFAHRVSIWKRRTAGTRFLLMNYEEALEITKTGDMVYCDPPYGHSQSILYGAQAFDLERLFRAISRCKSRGVYVALSLEGTKQSGSLVCEVPVPRGLFEREVYVNIGRSMLKRFQMDGQTLEGEVVADRLLLTY
jgi:DNA adenine methylase